MYIARWHFTANFGHQATCVELLRKWEVDVGQRIGWRLGSTRISSGLIGDETVELEVRLDDLGDLESAFKDMEKVPYHAQHMLDLAKHTTASRWTVHRVIDLDPTAS
jgi:hypothetical protein